MRRAVPLHLTSTCRRPPPASAPTSLRLPAAPEAQRWAPAARGEKPLRTLPRSGGSAPPGRVSRQDREPHRTRDGAPPTRAGVPRRGMRPCQGAPAGRASDAGRPADARSQAMRPPRPARTWEGGPPPSGRVASPCRGRGGSAQRARPGAAPPRCAWGGAACVGPRSAWPAWGAPGGTRRVAGSRGLRGRVRPGGGP